MMNALASRVLGPICIMLVMSFQAVAAEEPAALIERLGGQAIGIVANGADTTDDKQKKFEALFDEGFDVPLVAQIVLGRYWRTATAEQRDEFVNLFHKYIISTYASRLNAYSGQTFAVTGEQRLNDDEVMVKSVVKDPGGPDLKVDWRVLNRNGENRIVDVYVEGVSMAVTHRSEFASVIAQTGQVETLLERLRSQTGQG
ncbi:MAG: phospholipid-binding protein MlaC [Minwuia sp.]|uniref:MlaC/ttg2D family ABC transporter substrate-binding protein n=1 Tax=Minwuia sp. TaxID=2493630 RepID=UPI003A836FE1